MSQQPTFNFNYIGKVSRGVTAIRVVVGVLIVLGLVVLLLWAGWWFFPNTFDAVFAFTGPNAHLTVDGWFGVTPEQRAAQNVNDPAPADQNPQPQVQMIEVKTSSDGEPERVLVVNGCSDGRFLGGRGGVFTFKDANGNPIADAMPKIDRGVTGYCFDPEGWAKFVETTKDVFARNVVRLSDWGSCRIENDQIVGPNGLMSGAFDEWVSRVIAAIDASLTDSGQAKLPDQDQSMTQITGATLKLPGRGSFCEPQGSQVAGAGSSSVQSGQSSGARPVPTTAPQRPAEPAVPEPTIEPTAVPAARTEGARQMESALVAYGAEPNATAAKRAELEEFCEANPGAGVLLGVRISVGTKTFVLTCDYLTNAFALEYTLAYNLGRVLPTSEPTEHPASTQAPDPPDYVGGAAVAEEFKQVGMPWDRADQEGRRVAVHCSYPDNQYIPLAISVGQFNVQVYCEYLQDQSGLRMTLRTLFPPPTAVPTQRPMVAPTATSAPNTQQAVANPASVAVWVEFGMGQAEAASLASALANSCVGVAPTSLGPGVPYTLNGKSLTAYCNEHRDVSLLREYLRTVFPGS